MTARGVVVVVSPIEPSRTGNGLAMRVDLLVEAVSRSHDVHLVVVPVSGTPPLLADGVAASSRVTLEALGPGSHRGLDAWIGTARWRERLAALAPLPTSVARVPHGNADAAIAEVRDRVVAVFSCRLTTAPFGLHLAELTASPLVIDLDDDDEALAHDSDHHHDAEAWHRVARLTLGHSRLALGASRRVVEEMRRRHPHAPRIEVASNAAPVVARSRHHEPVLDGHHRVLMVANFDYAPNRRAADWLLSEVLPLLPRAWIVELVGPGDPCPGAHDESVHRVGFVPDLTPHYERATVAVAPLLTGSGTRIKILEAIAHRRPVVTTTVGADGLDLVHRHHVLVADEPSAFAEAVVQCADPATAARLTEQAHTLLVSTYDRAVVVDRISRLVHDAVALDPERQQPAAEDLQ